MCGRRAMPPWAHAHRATYTDNIAGAVASHVGDRRDRTSGLCARTRLLAYLEAARGRGRQPARSSTSRHDRFSLGAEARAHLATMPLTPWCRAAPACVSSDPMASHDSQLVASEPFCRAHNGLFATSAGTCRATLDPLGDLAVRMHRIRGWMLARIAVRHHGPRAERALASRACRGPRSGEEGIDTLARDEVEVGYDRAITSPFYSAPARAICAARGRVYWMSRRGVALGSDRSADVGIRPSYMAHALVVAVPLWSAWQARGGGAKLSARGRALVRRDDEWPRLSRGRERLAAPWFGTRTTRVLRPSSSVLTPSGRS